MATPRSPLCSPKSLDAESSGLRLLVERERVLAATQCLHQELEEYVEEIKGRAQASEAAVEYLQHVLGERDAAIKRLREAQQAAKQFSRAQDRQLQTALRQVQRLQRQNKQLKSGIRVLQHRRRQERLEREAEQGAGTIVLEEQEEAFAVRHSEQEARCQRLEQATGEKAKVVVVPLLCIEPPPPDLWLGTEWVLVRRSEAAAEPPGCLTGAETVLLDREHSEPPCEGRLSLCGSEECGLTPECRTPLEDAVGDDSFSQRLMRGLQTLSPRGLLHHSGFDDRRT